MQQELIPHLFRTEFSKITAVLCKHFGIEHIETAEDIACETFLSALETWPYKGIPPNPTAWLYAVAKNKTKNHLHRDQLLNRKIFPQIRQYAPDKNEIEIDWSEQNSIDSQLQMLFAICHPVISIEAQICLSLRLLCGFGIDEIAGAFLTNKETINKRLFRAKEKLRIEKIPIELPPPASIPGRLEAVLLTLYLLYNEGYYSETQSAVLREELCQEAMRLTRQLIDNEPTNTPETNALYALMSFHASRFPARKNGTGEIILYQDQDESLWDQDLIATGAWHLHLSARGNKLSRYHLEASIAYWHTIKADTQEKWENILQLYNRLLQIAYSPIAALNRTFALAKVNGKEQALIEAKNLSLKDNHYYHILLGELYIGIDDAKARESLHTAYALATTQADKQMIIKRIDNLF